MEASVWQRGLPDLPRFPTLCGDLRCEVAVVGAGMTGMLTAFALREQGFDTVLLESRIPGAGVTSRTTAKITAQHALTYSRLIDQLGVSLARRYARRQMEAVDAFEELIRRLPIDCEFQRAPSYLYARHDEERLQRELAAAQLAELPVRWVRETELPFPVAGAVRFDGQAYFHPLKFLYALVPHLRIFAHTRAERVENGIVYTEHGRVRANHIVVTTRLPFPDLPGINVRRLHREKACVLALEGVPKLHGMYQDASAGGLSLRPYPDGILLAGGRHKVGPLPIPERCSRLTALAQSYWPDCRVTAGWTCSDWFPADGVPYVGAYVGRRADLYVASGFSGRGMSSAMVAARFISGRIGESRD